MAIHRLAFSVFATLIFLLGGQAFAQNARSLESQCLRKDLAINQSGSGPFNWEVSCKLIALYEGECAGTPQAAREVSNRKAMVSSMGATCPSSPAPQARATAPNSSSTNATAPMRPGGWGASHCLSLGKVWSGGISTESAILKNSCNEKVNYTYCVDSAGDGFVSCRKQKFGAGSVRANGEDAITVMGEKRPMQVHWNACFEDGQFITPLSGRFTGSELAAQCRPLMGR